MNDALGLLCWVAAAALLLWVIPDGGKRLRAFAAQGPRRAAGSALGGALGLVIFLLFFGAFVFWYGLIGMYIEMVMGFRG